MWTQDLRASLAIGAVMTALCGVIYPLSVTALAHALASDKAQGSLIATPSGEVVGSEHVGQPFTRPDHLWPRPSAAGYNGASSGASNMGPLHPDLEAAMRERVAALKAADPANTQPTPVDLITASASGLDPHISPAAARYQAGRIAQARGLAVEQVQQIIDQHTQGRTLGVYGEPRVHVLRVNLALDALAP